jgi:hypothetical protein
MYALLYYLKIETELFLETKGKHFSQLYTRNHDWMRNFASYMDVPHHMNEVNISLLRTNHLCVCMYV